MGIETETCTLRLVLPQVELPRAVWELKHKIVEEIFCLILELPRAVWELKLRV